MDNWHILSVVCVCMFGALTFLKLVADELDALSSELGTVRRREEARGAERVIEARADTDVVESVLEKLA